MRLYVCNKNTNQKIYITGVAATRNQLAQQMGSYYFTVNGMFYSVNEVRAEPTSESTIFGALAGGLLGAITGGTGLIVGALGGALLGNNRDSNEQQNVSIFNRSHVQIHN